MKNTFVVKQVAVLGAGVMGAQIAAQCVNAGITTLLFDLAASEGDRQGIVDKAILNLTKLSPSPLASKETASLIRGRNYDDNIQELLECDLIIEAIAERLDWKEALYKRIAPFINEKAILVSNTSGLSINTLASVLPSALQTRFCGVHFFNPPRYMHLAEIIPAKETPTHLLDNLESWLTSYLGKGIVRAKDTPNFIANRIGVFSLLVTLYHAQQMELGFDEVDALTGSLIGRPKSATFRTMDVVGLDTMMHVVNTMTAQLKDDPWHRYYQLPDWLLTMIEQGHLGQKSGQGIYRKQGKVIEVFDVTYNAYRPANAKISEEITEIMAIKEGSKRWLALSKSTHKQARFLVACFQDLFHYAAFHLKDIAETTRDIDEALCWGFGWQHGPFLTWQQAGVVDIRQILKDAIDSHSLMASAPLPSWLDAITCFYERGTSYNPSTSTYQGVRSLPVYQRQQMAKIKPSVTLFENDGVVMWHVTEEIAALHFKTKSNCIGQSVLDGLHTAIDYVEANCQGLVIYQQDGANFSAGADLKSVGALIKDNKMTTVEGMIKSFQEAVMRLKYCKVPTVAGLRGRALGGGCELMMHCHRVIAAFESYPGLVEVGVGLIPAGGGCKEMAIRAANAAEGADLMHWLSRYYQQIATAFVPGSAIEAQQKGYLQATDSWVMHTEEVMYAAIHLIKSLNAANFMPPLAKPVKVAGIEGAARLKAGLINWFEGQFISAHDYEIGTRLAEVITGGNVNQGTLVDEQWLLELERKVFIELASMPSTQERIAHMLVTGKPLRN